MSINPDISKITNSTKEDWIENFARFGLIAKGIVYCLLGILAAMAAFGLGGKTTDKGGVFRFILEQPFGKVLLGLVALGLAGYVMWRFIQAIKDTEKKGNDTKGIMQRLGFAGSGIIYAALAFYAIKLIINGDNGDDGNSSQHFVSKLLEQPFGQWLVGAVALGIFGKALYQFYRAFSGKFKKSINAAALSEKQRKVFMTAGRGGYISRGVVLSIISYFFLRAALDAKPNEAKGTEEAFGFLKDSAYGAWLMGIVALGLVGYGIFMFVRAKYQRINAG